MVSNRTWGLARWVLALASVVFITGKLFAHPMGNFSVNHYSKITIGQRSIEILYLIDMAEIPTYQEILNSDSEMFGGSNMGNGGCLSSQEIPMHNRPHSIAVTLPPLSVVVFKKV